jgi:hypothetical protein
MATLDHGLGGSHLPIAARLPRSAGAVVRVVIGAAAVALVAAAALFPLWRAHLVAPQYPGGLHMYAYGDRVTGDVEEIDLLNHYIGMRPFDPADVPEMALWPAAVAVAVAAAVVGTWRRRGWLHRLSVAYLWALPVGILADIQLRLHQYGTDLDPGAALRIPEFTPWVLGPTTVWNFSTRAYPGIGLLLLVAAALLVTAGPRLAERLFSRGD